MGLRWPGLSQMVRLVLGKEMQDVGEGFSCGLGQECPDSGGIYQGCLDVMSRRES